MVYQVFIAHSESEEDKPIVYRCADWLKANNIGYYLAELSFEAKPLPDKIENAMRTSDCVLVLQTQKGALSTWVQHEAAMAKAFHKPLIVIVEKGVEVKGLLQSIEHIVLDRSNRARADDAFHKVTSYLVKAKELKEASERTAGFILGSLALMFIIGLAGLAASKEG
jgi:hypothetical protein